MIFRSLVMLFLSSALIAQQSPAPNSANSAAEASATPAEWAGSSMHSLILEKSEYVPPSETAVPYDSPVIVIQGACDNQPASSPECRTLVSRADFEAAVDAIDPDMPAGARQTLTNQYVEMVVLARKAHALGLENSEGYRTARDYMLKGSMGKLYVTRLQKESKNLSDADVDEFYRENPRLFEEIKTLRIVIPQTKGFGALPKEARPTPEQIAATHSEMKKEAESIAQRAALPGADFQALENEGWKFSNFADVAPDVAQAPLLRWEIWPLTRLPIFDLKVGEVSPVIDEPRNGLYIYKILAKRQVPLAEARSYIRYRYAALRNEDAIAEVTQTMKFTLNDEYFGAPQLMGHSPQPTPEPQESEPALGPTLDIKIPRKMKP